MVSRVAFSLFGFDVYWYGIILTAGMMAASWIAARELQRKGHDPNIAWNGMILVLALGIIGGRLYHVFSTPGDGVTAGWAYYRENPLQILAIRNGGLGIYGGLIGGLIGVIITAIRAKFPFFRLGDCVVPGVALGQAIGRWGNFVNQELYGGPTGSSWWGVPIEAASRVRTRQFDFTDLRAFPLETRFHPTFLYESLWNVAGCLLMLSAARRYAHKLRDGDIGGFFFIWYGVGRAWTELLFRPDAWVIGASSLPAAVLVSLIGIIGGLAVIISGRVFKRPFMADTRGEFTAAPPLTPVQS